MALKLLGPPGATRGAFIEVSRSERIGMLDRPIRKVMLMIGFGAFFLISIGAAIAIAVSSRAPTSHDWILIASALSVLAGFFVILWFVSPIVTTIWIIGPGRRTFINYVHQKMEQERGREFTLDAVQVSKRMRRSLAAFDNDEELQFLVMRNACFTFHVNLVPPFKRPSALANPASPTFLEGKSVGHALNHVLVSAIARELRSFTSPMHGQGAWYHDVITTRDRQRSRLSDQGDLPLRFVQATPHHPFPGEQESEHELPQAAFVMLVCLTNPIYDPVYVQDLRFVMQRLKQNYDSDEFLKDHFATFDETHDEHDLMGQLCTEQYRMFHRIKQDTDPWERDVLTYSHDEYRSVISHQRNGTQRLYRSGYDIDKISPTSIESLDRARVSLMAFIKAIRQSRHAEAEVVLRRGDILVIKNYTALHRRKEIAYSIFSKPTILPLERWFRTYFCFPNENFNNQHQWAELTLSGGAEQTVEFDRS